MNPELVFYPLMCADEGQYAVERFEDGHYKERLGYIVKKNNRWGFASQDGIVTDEEHDVIVKEINRLNSLIGT
jgi:hypothetical protein